MVQRKSRSGSWSREGCFLGTTLVPSQPPAAPRRLEHSPAKVSEKKGDKYVQSLNHLLPARNLIRPVSGTKVLQVTNPVSQQHFTGKLVT